MLERHNGLDPDPGGAFTYYDQAQATIADLQGQVDQANRENAQANDETRRILHRGIQDRDVKISQLQQRVAQLEQQAETYLKAAQSAHDGHRAAVKYTADLQADHARVLGLLAQVTEIADMMLKGTECEHDVGLCSCEHRRIVKQAQRSLPAQPAQGGAHG